MNVKNGKKRRDLDILRVILVSLYIGRLIIIIID